MKTVANNIGNTRHMAAITRDFFSFKNNTVPRQNGMIYQHFANKNFTDSNICAEYKTVITVQHNPHSSKIISGCLAADPSDEGFNMINRGMIRDNNHISSSSGKSVPRFCVSIISAESGMVASNRKNIEEGDCKASKRMSNPGTTAIHK